MSCFMSSQGSVCMHEPTAYMSKIEDLKVIYQDQNGVSDSGLGFWLDWILREIQPLTVIIERDIKQVENSIAKLKVVPKTNYCELLKSALEKIKDSPLIMRVPFDSLGDVRVMRKVFWHLRPGVAFDEGRFESMNRMNLTCNVKDKIEQSKKDTIYREIAPLIRLKE